MGWWRTTEPTDGDESKELTRKSGEEDEEEEWKLVRMRNTWSHGGKCKETPQKTPNKAGSGGLTETKNENMKIASRSETAESQRREGGCRRSWIFSRQKEAAEGPDLTSQAETGCEKMEDVSRQPVPREKVVLRDKLSLSSVNRSLGNEKRGSFFGLSRKTSQEKLVIRRTSVWDPRIYLRRILSPVRFLLHLTSLSVVYCWERVNKGLKLVGKSIANFGKSAMSALVDFTPRKIVKWFMIHTCRVMPYLRHRSIVLSLFDTLPSRVTKRVVSVYFKKVPLWFMRAHIMASLRDGPAKKMVDCFTSLAQLPRTLLKMAFMSVASALEVVSRALTFSRPQETVRSQSRLPPWKVKRQTSLPCKLVSKNLRQTSPPRKFENRKLRQISLPFKLEQKTSSSCLDDHSTTL